MDYEIQFARLITQEKLPDRFLNARLLSNPDLSKSSMGEMFSMVEILAPWFSTSQIGQTIINTFFDSYYEGGSTSDLVNFENSLKKVNLALAKITQNGETDWLGKLNSTLGVIIENKMHLAQAGRAETYIFRDGKINHLTEGLADNNEPHPLTTFSNITSGELKHGDKIFIANPELYQYISLENLRQIVTMSTPKEAVLQIGKLLKKKKANCVNVLIINLSSSIEISKETVESGSETVYLDKPLDSVLHNIAKAWHGIIYPIFKFIGNKGKNAGNKSIDFTKNYLNTLHNKRQAAATPKKRDLYEKEFINSSNEDTLLKDEEINYSPDLDVHYYNEAEKKKNNKIAQMSSVIFSKISIIFSKIKSFILTLFHNKKTRPYLYVFIAIILLIFIGLIIKNRSNNSSSNMNLNQAQVVLKQAENNEADAGQALLLNDPEKAKVLFSSAIDKASKIKTTPIVKDAAQNVINNCYSELDKLTNTTRFNEISPILALDTKPNGFYIISGKTYFTSGSDIYRGLISGGTPKKVGSIPGSTISLGTIIGNNIYLYTTNQKMYEFDTLTEKINSATISGNWETANAVSAFSSSIYLLDGIIGQIYKHGSSSNGFNGGESYITNANIDIKNAVSITIDGDIYVLKNSGEVMKFKKSKLQNFSLQNVPTPSSIIEKPLKIYTDADASSIYILDSGQKRIIEFDKNGGYLHQYVMPNIDAPSDFVVNIKAKKMWVLSGSALYEIGI